MKRNARRLTRPAICILAILAFAFGSTCAADSRVSDRAGIKTARQTIRIAGKTFVAYGDLLIEQKYLRSASVIPVRLWPGGRIPVQFRSEVPFSARQSFFEACNAWGAEANISCFTRAAEPDFLDVTNGADCVIGAAGCSLYGVHGGPQLFGIRDWYAMPVILHELGHALGLAHEHQRFDRDVFVQINFQHVLPQAIHAFDRINTRYESYYDYASVMHYGANAASADGYDTITTLDPAYSAIIGNAEVLSRRDRLAAMKLYGSKSGLVNIEVPVVVGKYLSVAQGLLRLDYGLTAEVTAGPTQRKIIRLTNCEREIIEPEVVTQVPAAGTMVAFGSVVEVVTTPNSEFVMRPPPPGKICE
jgi:hypothetical protein